MPEEKYQKKIQPKEKVTPPKVGSEKDRLKRFGSTNPEDVFRYGG